MNTNSFQQMKATRQDQLDRIYKELNKINSPSSFSDSTEELFWQPSVDKAGNGYAVIRFLPGLIDEEVAFVRVWTHGFKGPTGNWYIENSRTTIGENDPVSDYNSKLWNSGSEKDKEIARTQKRRLHFVSNILVVKDPANPENEGKVFLYKYGKKLFNKLNDLMHPQFDDETPINPFDMWTGANLKLKIRKVEGYRNYDKSEFETSSIISQDEGVMEKIFNSQHSLKQFIDPSKFKSYEDLQKKFDRVMGNMTTVGSPVSNTAKPVAKKPDYFDESDTDSEDFDKFFEKINSEED